MRRTVLSTLGVALAISALFAVPLGAAHAEDGTPASPPSSQDTTAPPSASSTPTFPPPTATQLATTQPPTTPPPSPTAPPPSTPPPSSTTPPPPTPTPPNSGQDAVAESPIAVRYRETGGAAGPLGAVVTPEADIPGGRIAVYAEGEIRWSEATGARIVWPHVTAQLDPRLGFPTNELTCDLVDDGCRQDFQSGAVLHHPTAGTHAVLGHIGQRYSGLGLQDGRLRYPVDRERCGIKDNGCYQRFQNGIVYWSNATGAQPVWGRVLWRYGTLSYERSRLGLPTTGENCGIANNGCYQHFQGGSIHWSSATDAQATWGMIRQRWAGLGWERSRLGYPTGGETCGIKDNGCYQRFQNGIIYWSNATGAQPIWGRMLWRYGTLSYERSQLGLPTTGENCGIRDNGCYQHFQGGTIHWSPATDAQATWGGIRQRWAGLGWERSRLGYPTGPEYCGFRDNGCLQRFQGGIMYWSARSGAHPTWGAILARYGQLRWENSPLGYPTSGESCVSSSSCRQTFQYGEITWSSSLGAIERYLVNAVTRATTAADVQHTYRSGCPVGASGLRTIEMNHWGYDGRIHRGVLIIKTSLAAEVVAAFTDAFNARWRIARMSNPNVWGGNDPLQMTANNTSGFNCRTVVGNPYAMSPHSYGIAIDTNTVQNPYRDRNGTWWPSNGRDYILGAVLNRQVTHSAVMTTSSSFTRALESRGWFWGGRWSPGRDYHHFEKR